MFADLVDWGRRWPGEQHAFAARDAMRVEVDEGRYLRTFPHALSILAESEGHKPC